MTRKSRLVPACLIVLIGMATGACAAPVPPPSVAEPSRTPVPTMTMTPTPVPQPSTPTPSPERADLYLITAFADAHLVLFDPDRGEIARIEVGRAPWGVAVAPDGLAYVATLDGVAVVDVAARERIGLIGYASDLALGPEGGEYRAGGLGIAVAPDGGRVYVGVTTHFPDPGVLEVIDTATRSTIASLPLGIRQFDMVVSADGGEIYAINHDSFDVTVVDADALTILRTLPAAPLGDELGLGSWNKPHYAALTGAGTLLMAYKGVLLLELDPRTGEVSQRPLRASTHSQGVELTPDGVRLLVVGDGPNDTSLAGPSLEVVDLATGESTVTPLSGSHNDAAMSLDGKHVYLTGGSSREGAPRPDVITLVDLDSSEVISEVDVSGNPLIIVPWPAR
ncbi:MAG: YncE family protein [Candidatus Limnocylindria bacterium]